MIKISTDTRLNYSRRIPYVCFALLLVLVAGPTLAYRPAQQAGQKIEEGKFRLHKFEQPIGEETYEIDRDGDSQILHDAFEFTDRGSKVPLTATLQLQSDLTPQKFEIKGRNSRFSTIDASAEINNRTAIVRINNETKQTSVPDRFFVLDGYAPIAAQMMMLRYADQHKVQGALKTFPSGEINIEFRGQDKIAVGGKQVTLKRYLLSGIIWGRESIWVDDNKQLIAAVTVDAEFDHFEAIRDGYEDALPVFVAKAADDGMVMLASLAKKTSPVQKSNVAIVGGTLIDGTGNAPLENATVLIKNGKIVAAGNASKVTVPKDALVIDARGKSILPGLWEMHAHFEQVEWGPIYLAAGVTTVRDVGNEFEFITAVKTAIESGRGVGPRLLLAGVVDGTSEMALGVIRADDPDQARAVVKRYKDAGFQQIKIYSSIKPDIVKVIAEEAHRLGMTVTGHVPNGMNAIQFVEAGADQINHVQYIRAVMLPKPVAGGPRPALDLQSPEAKNAIQFLKDHGTVLDDTLAIFELFGHSTDVNVASFEPGISKIAPELAGPLNNAGVPPAQAANVQTVFNEYLTIVGALHRAGVPIVAGTDQSVPGHSVYREIELYTKAGFTPIEAIQAATIVPARVMKLDKELGTIEVGKRADVIIVDGNPLQSISDIRKVKTVIKDGRVFDSAGLWQSVGFKP